MSAIDPRAASTPWFCGWCRTTRSSDEHMWPLAIGTTESSGCIDCAMDRDELTAPRGDDT